jgi:RNA polymerase sigma-70 factor (ECF subfamily)
MITVAINEALQWYRRERRRPHYQAMFEPDVLVSNGESPHQRCSRVEVTRAVRRAVMRLPQKYKEVLVLRDLEELSTRETAQRPNRLSQP